MDKSGLYHFGLLGCCSSPNGRVLGIARESDFGTIAVGASAVAFGTAMDRDPAGCRGWRSNLHCCRRVLSRLRENGEVSCFAGTICRSGEGGPGGWGIGETTHVGRKGEVSGRDERDGDSDSLTSPQLSLVYIGLVRRLRLKTG